MSSMGQDGTYEFSGGGSMFPSSCDGTVLSGSDVRGLGYALSSSFVLENVQTISGVLQFDGMGTITTNWNSATGTGTYT